MQRTNGIILGIGMGLCIISCEQKGKTEQQEKSVDRLENFVDSVETAVNREANHNWTVLDNRYNKLVSNVEASYDDSKEKAREKYEDLEERYEEAKVEARNKTAKMQEDAERHMSNVESWWERNTARAQQGTRNTMDDIEEGAKDSWEWLEKNTDKLGDDIRARYEKIKSDLEG
ncbi:hypothetical protein [Arthrospiribacter ruber]|uniref:Uncharacterized protein n=1 Tax=Arthrospiribacter ruber TaxID=2487934 RepID=A0A951IXD6_9BACT|nr:hypothetical protein [Arthrospiribacter ruber]MBW3468538.1 hypothetical protein [Arthrospiribacter ruber]